MIFLCMIYGTHTHMGIGGCATPKNPLHKELPIYTLYTTAEIAHSPEVNGLEQSSNVELYTHTLTLTHLPCVFEYKGGYEIYSSSWHNLNFLCSLLQWLQLRSFGIRKVATLEKMKTSLRNFTHTHTQKLH